MKIIIENIEELDDPKQVELGRKFLNLIFFQGIRVDGVKVRFEK